MRPTLNPHSQDASPKQDYVLLNKWIYSFFNPSRGEVVVFISPKDPKKILVKRVVGIAGDCIRTSPSTHSETDPKLCKLNPMEKCKVPKNAWIKIPDFHVWLESDGQGNHDSLEVGPVPLGLLIGRVEGILWPWNRIHKSLDYIPRVNQENRFISNGS